MDDQAKSDNEPSREKDCREMEQSKRHYEQVQNSRQLLCIHEAGHAVVAVLLKMDVSGVTVKGFNDSYTEVKRRLPPPLENLHDELIMAISGYNAVLKETGDPYAANMHAGRDYAYIDWLFETLLVPEEKQAEWMNKAKTASMEPIQKCRSAVKSKECCR